MIAFGTLLLMLPIAHSSGTWGDWVVALFTSTSAVCVTGLVVVDTGTYFSWFGQFFITLLVQVGGLGYMTATTFLLILIGRRLGLRDKIAIQQSLDKEGLSGAGQLIKSIIAVTLIFELTGAFAMMPVFIPDYGWNYGIWLALFHSVSAFNNAGFGLFPDNMIGYATSIPINLVIPLLIIFGGIGYGVIMDMYFLLRDRVQRRRSRLILPLNFKIALSTTFVLLVAGTISLLLVEYSNPGTFGPFNFGDKLKLAWFQAVVPRTAGFNSTDYTKMTESGWFITIILMFIGASPGGTGGGIKTTTFRVLFDCMKAVLRGKTEVVCYQRQIPLSLVLKAVGVVFGSLITVIVATALIEIADPQVELIRSLFEVVSGFATVGLSTGITAGLSTFSKLVLVATMYIGRVGVLLLMSAIVGDPEPTAINYPEENLLVG